MSERIPEVMRVPWFRGQGRVEWREKSTPQPKEGELLLRCRANALCGSERGQFHGGSATTPGHEAAGVVALAGPETRTAVGTPGVVYLMVYCGDCRNCRAGATQQCLAKRGDVGFNRDGGYGPYMTVPESVFFPVDSDLPLDEATLLLDVMGTGGHAIGRAQRVHDDLRSLLIMGAGPIGLGLAAMARILLGEATRVFITDTIPYRLDLASRLGAIPIPGSTQSLEEALRAHACPHVDAALDTTGKTEARQAALNALDQRGVLVCVGHGEGLTLEVSRDLIAPERAILGSEYFRYDELAANLELFRQHRNFLQPIITHRFPVERVEDAFRLFFAGETGKVVVTQ